MSVLKTYGNDTGFKSSVTYQISDNRLERRIDGLDAVKQAASLLLTVERFEHLIYSNDYGNEIVGFIGKDRGYVKGDIERRIIESLQEDDRIEGISSFKLSFDGETALVSFVINSTYGDFEMERSATLG